MKIAYSGIEGAFAHIASRRIFPGEELVSFADFRSAYEAAESGECDYAVLPIENSYAGEVGQVTDLMFQGKLFVSGTYNLNVMQNLLGVPGSSLQTVRRVISHPQALEQSADFLREHGILSEEAVNTARAARHVAELNDVSVGAVASEETAALYGLQILERGINGKKDNSTRFAIFSRDEKAKIGEQGGAFILMFALKNEAGALVKVLNRLSEFGYNMSVIHSRPLMGHAWEYYFYIEVEGDVGDEAFNQMILEMRYRCEKLKVLGK